MSRSLRVLVATVVVASLLAPPAAAARPTNDLYRGATAVTSLPFSVTQSTTSATAETGEPAGCGDPRNTVWFTYTAPTDQIVRISTIGSSYDALAVAYVVDGRGFGGLTPLGCPGRSLALTGGATYAIQVTDENPSGGGGSMTLSITAAVRPANDNFASAASITSVPFSTTVDILAATTEPGEPDAAGCLDNPPMRNTVWYSYTPAVDGTVQFMHDPAFFSSAAVMYTGSSLGTLTKVDCAFRAQIVHAGVTYYIQFGAQSVTPNTPADIQLRAPDQPAADFAVYPPEPNAVSPTAFFENIREPGGRFWTSQWSFGDGGTSADDNASHQYAADGDYTVGLTITTDDGRTASAQQIISVRTHDVTLTAFSAPKSARSGQTKTVSVSFLSRRYPETVVIRIFRGDATGQSYEVFNLAQDVTVSTRATTVTFPYTFTTDDAAAGPITFVASVAPIGHDDALPGDNSAQAVTAIGR